MKNNNDIALLILRAGVSILMMTHGYPKCEKLFAGGEIEFYDFMGLGPKISLMLTVVGELLAPILLVFGFFTRWAAIPAVITMAVAALMVHAGDPFGDKEHSLLYLCCFLTILIAGPGKYSLDKVMKR